MSDASEGHAFLVVTAGFGVWLFYDGFKKLWLHRKARGLPTAKIHAAAMGTVEVCGRALSAAPLTDPIFGRPCVFYRITIKVPERFGWRTCEQVDSAETPFYLEDDTGCAMIDPAKAEIHLGSRVCAQSGFGETKDPEPLVAAYLKQLKKQYGLVKFEADIIREGFPIYALGVARPAAKIGETRVRPISLRDVVRRLKGDSARMAAMDENDDGRLAQEEWDRGLAAYRKELAESGATETVPLANIAVGTGPQQKLVLADSEEQLFGKLAKLSLYQIAGGPLLTAAALLYLFWGLGWL